MDSLELVAVKQDITALVPHPTNARTHPRRQIEQLKASMREFGFVNPILVDANNVVIAGHGRLQAVREPGMTEVPTIQVGHLSDGQVRALRLADNRIALNSGWDPDLLRAEIVALGEMEIELDFNTIGFSEGEINVILDPGTDPDDEVIPALRSEPRTASGDMGAGQPPGRLR